MTTIDNFDWAGKKALIRVDFNVPLNNDFQVTDDTRIRAALPTVKAILNQGGSVVLMSHLGRPKNGPEEKFSLYHLVQPLSQLLETEVKFGGDCIGDNALESSENLKSGEVLLLENLRFYKEEKAGDLAFAQKLAKHGDIYVNDAFGTAHRAHASTAVIAEYFSGNKCFGYVMAGELQSVQKLMNEAEKPTTAIIGGAKVSSKIGIIENLLPKADHIIIGGGMSYTFAKAQGGKIGNSLCEDDFLDTAKEVLKKAKEQGVEIHLPVDSINADSFSNDANRALTDAMNIPDGWMGMDIGPKTIENYKQCIMNSKTILWNGPMGVFEFENFSKGTEEAALAVAASTKNGAYSLVGGGDSVAAVNKFKLANDVSYVSTGGGALLELIEGKELPGVKAIMS